MVALWIVLCVVLGIVLWLVGVVAVFNVRRLRSRRSAAKLQPTIRREILELIDRAGAEDGTPVVLLRPDPEASRAPSKLGGDPELPDGVDWPRDEAGGVAPFLAQVCLQSPPLPCEWLGRRISLFRVGEQSVVVRSDPPRRSPTSTDASTASADGRLPFAAVRLPRVQPEGESVDEILSPYDPSSLCRRVPAVRNILARFTRTPERLLPFVLIPGIITYEMDTFLVSLMGGEPELIQGDHGASCPECSRPMRFLFHVGDVLDLTGDAPIVYVYGCDAHLHQVDAFVDVH